MGRTAQGWKLIPPRERTGTYHVRFTHEGKRHHCSTGCTNSRSAQKAAARIYAEVVSGRHREPTERVGAVAGRPLDELMAEWLAAKEAEVHASTFAQYEMYVSTYLLPFFGELENITTASAAAYVRKRLGAVTRTTVTKELSALRGFVNWCEEVGHLPEAPRIKAPPRKSTGTRASKRRTVELVPEQVEAIIAALPDRSRGGGKPKAFYALLWETGLRKATIERLVAEDFRPGDSVLIVRDEADKARFGRVLPLTARACEVLREVCPETGEVFGKRDMRTTLRKAARAAGIGKDDARFLSNHDFRHGRTTHLLEHSDNLVGVAYLMGHKQITTTNRYVKPLQRAGEAVLRAAEAANSGADSGAEAQKQESPAEAGPSVSDRNHSSAEERTRTSTPFRAQEPESCASASSATSAGSRKGAEIRWRRRRVKALAEGSRGGPKSLQGHASSAVRGVLGFGSSGWNDERLMEG